MTNRLAKKVFVLGIDGMDPRFTRYMLSKGKMPHTQRLIDRGGQREDLVLQGSHPTVTPPMWTTLSTGALPVTHGITAFSRTRFEDGLEYSSYNLDSNFCLAEQLWNVTAEAGIKTLVFHWPGCSWPPTSDSPNLHVVDGTTPGVVNMGVAQVEADFVLVADVKTEETIFRRKCASDTHVPCVITDLAPEPTRATLIEAASGTGDYESLKAIPYLSLALTENDGERGLSANPFDVVLTPIKEAQGWADAPEGAKEFVMLFSNGLVRRVALILPNAQGIYDKIAIYKTKKALEPIVVLENDVYTSDIVDIALKNDVQYEVTRSMRIIELDEKGEHVKLWVSAALDINNDTVWHPKRLYQSVKANCGNTPPQAVLGGGDEVLITKCMRAAWDEVGEWYGRAIKHLIDTEYYEMIFSHFHNIDAQGHMLIKYLKDRGANVLSEDKILELMEGVYIQTDNYIGQFMDMLEDEWTLMVVSDHGQICGEYEPPMIGDSGAVDIGIMRELGFTEVKKDEAGNDLYEIDWAKTKAISKSSNHIYLNLKGRTEHGIIDPEDQYEVEEEIITALYGYRYPETGKRVIAMALRNKDAALLGVGGPMAGDIIYWLTEGYNYDHVDSLSTTLGVKETSVSPIFIAAGPGIKPGFTERIIRECDVAPTIAALFGIRMPAQCEGAPVYQIIDYR